MGQLVKQFTNHFGLDLKTNEINRDPRFASDILNAQYKKNGNIGKRQGFRGAAESIGGYGANLYERIDPTTGLTDKISVTIDGNLHRLNISTFTIAYAGADASVVPELFFDDAAGEYVLQITEGTVTVLDTGLDVGFDEASSKTLADLKVEIDAIGNFTATIVGVDTVPAAFLEFIRNVNLADGDVTTQARHWTQVNTTVTDPFAPFFANRQDEDFENMSFAMSNNVLFMIAKDVDLHKYDGQNVYRAGVPIGITPTVALGAAGIPAATYIYQTRYTQIDRVGNLVDSQPSPDSASITPASQIVDVTVTNILNTTGFNTNAAIAVGAQAGVNTITVDDGSGGAATLLVGDKAYFDDTSSGGFVTRNVTAVTATTITIDGAAVDISDNSVISNDLRIGIYRNLAASTTKFLVAEIPNNPFTATQVFADNKADSALGFQLIVPQFDETAPPKAKYVAVYNNQLLLANGPDDPNIVYWTPAGLVENFAPILRNTLVGENITAIAQDNEVIGVWEQKKTHIISGDLVSNNIRVDILNEDIGCVAHHTVQEVRGTTYFLSDRGVFRMVSGQQPQAISEQIEPIFDIDPRLTSTEKLQLKRSIAINHREKEQYILYIPAETTRGADIESNSSSRLLVQDYFRGAWLEWSNMNLAGGAIVVDQDLFWIERRFSSFESDVEHILYKQQNRADNWDFEDNTVALSFLYGTAWYHFDEPSIYKKWLRFKIFGIEETDFNPFTLDVDIEKDFIETFVTGNFVMDFSTSGEGYGIAPYGTLPYGDLADPSRKVKIGPIKARALRFLLKNENHRENVDITGWEIELANIYRPELKE